MTEMNYIIEIEGEERKKWIPILKKMGSAFLEEGFQKKMLGKRQFYQYKSVFCKITPLQFPDKSVKFVLEWADNEEDASKDLLEDGDLYPAELSEDELISMLRKDLQRQIRSFL